MLKSLSYRKARALQICVVFSVAIFVQELLGYTHAGWIGFTVMMIYAGFDRGASLERTTQRFWGAMFGLFLSFLLWIVGQIDYRLIRVIIPIIVFFAFFSLGKLYAFPTVFTVTLTALGTDFYGSSSYASGSFFIEYFIFTVIAFLICLIFDHYIFKDNKLSHKFFIDLQKTILTNLTTLFNIVNNTTLRRGHYLKATAQLNVSVLELYAFTETAKYDIQDINLLDELSFFSSEMQQVYHNIRRLYILAPFKNDLLVFETSNILEQLAKVNQNQRIKYIGE